LKSEHERRDKTAFEGVVRMAASGLFVVLGGMCRRSWTAYGTALYWSSSHDVDCASADSLLSCLRELHAYPPSNLERSRAYAPIDALPFASRYGDGTRASPKWLAPARSWDSLISAFHLLCCMIRCRVMRPEWPQRRHPSRNWRHGIIWDPTISPIYPDDPKVTPSSSTAQSYPSTYSLSLIGRSCSRASSCHC
jgi:hypothetical protein